MACPFSAQGVTSNAGTSSPPVWADPLGPSSLGKGGVAQYGTSGAPQMRQGLFNYMNTVAPSLQAGGASIASKIPSDVNDPFYGQAKNLARGTLAGNYLSGSPELNRAMAANTSQALSSAADQDARLKSEFGKSGMGFSTGFTQASEANKAAAAADAARTNAGTFLQNYMMERGNQNAAPAAFSQAQFAPLNYLNQATQASLSPASQQGGILSALSSGGQVITPNTHESTTPSEFATMMNAMGAMTSL